MGRREVLPDAHERWVFNRLAPHYRARPDYPPALIDRLVALADGREAVDLGAGTGAVALALARRGLKVTAVEPARAMLDLLEEQARHERLAVSAVHASAEETGLAARFGLAVLADAAHWVDPALAGAELSRLLAPGGVLAVVQPAFARTPFMDAVRARLARENPRSNARPTDDAQLFALTTGAALVEQAQLEQAVTLDEVRLEAVLRSISYVGPALGEARLQALLADVRALAQVHVPEWARVITLRWARRSR